MGEKADAGTGNIDAERAEETRGEKKREEERQVRTFRPRQRRRVNDDNPLKKG